MAHDTLLFNLHDFMLLFAVGQYLLLALFLIFTRQPENKSTTFLILILLFNALQSSNTFLIWSEPIRGIVLNWNTNLLFLGGLGFWLQGPLLYWYVSSVLYRGFIFRRSQLTHLIPAVAALILLYLNYYSLPKAEQILAMQSLEFMRGAPMNLLVLGRNLSVIIYGLWSLYTLFHYRSQVRQQYAGYNVSERKWLLWVVVGIVSLSAWCFLVQLISTQISNESSNVLGIISNYLSFIFVNSLVFLSIRQAPLFEGLSPQLTADQNDARKNLEEPKQEHIERINKYMKDAKPYLRNDIHIESLAKQVSIPVRSLSHTINRHFKVNFFEFINTYRIEEAKRLLLAPESCSKTVIDIMHEAGFSSKSNFNSTFKQHVKMTPSEFRKRSLTN